MKNFCRVFFLSFSILCAANITNAHTTIDFNITNNLEGNIFGLSFDVTSTGDIGTFDMEDSIMPDGWEYFSSDSTFSFYDATLPGQGEYVSLPSGILGSFDSEVTLSNFVLYSGDGTALTFDLDFWVLFDEDTNIYTISGSPDPTPVPTPIPSAILLFGGGLLGTLGIRRKIKQ